LSEFLVAEAKIVVKRRPEDWDFTGARMLLRANRKDCA